MADLTTGAKVLLPVYWYYIDTLLFLFDYHTLVICAIYIFYVVIYIKFNYVRSYSPFLCMLTKLIIKRIK